MAIKWLKRLVGSRSVEADPDDAARIIAQRSEAAYEAGKADRRCGRPSCSSRFLIGREQLAYIQGYSVNPSAAALAPTQAQGDEQ